MFSADGWLNAHETAPVETLEKNRTLRKQILTVGSTFNEILQSGSEDILQWILRWMKNSPWLIKSLTVLLALSIIPYYLLDLRQDRGLHGNIVNTQQVPSELIKKHLIALLIAPIVLRMILLDAVIGQVAGHILEVRAIIGLWGGPQNTLAIKVDVVLMVNKHPAPKLRELTYHVTTSLTTSGLTPHIWTEAWSYLISNLRWPGSNSSGLSRYFWITWTCPWLSMNSSNWFASWDIKIPAPNIYVYKKIKTKKIKTKQIKMITTEVIMVIFTVTQSAQTYTNISTLTNFVM